jgi:hypothetical protein
VRFRIRFRSGNGSRFGNGNRSRIPLQLLSPAAVRGSGCGCGGSTAQGAGTQLQVASLSAREPPEHRQESVEKHDGLGNLGRREVAPGRRDTERRPNLLGTSGCDPPGVQSVGPASPPTLGEVQ